MIECFYWVVIFFVVGLKLMRCNVNIYLCDYNVNWMSCIVYEVEVLDSK